MMKRNFWIQLAVVGAAIGVIASAHAAESILTQQNDHVVPSTRGQANTTWFGWDVFGAPGTPVNNSTPDMGTTTVGPVFQTIGGGSRISSTGNFYSGSEAPNEEITIVTDGAAEAGGKTTIIMQAVTVFGGFPGAWQVGSIDGVAPIAVVQGTNGMGRGQLWAKWELPGKQESYVVRLQGAPGTSMYSMNKIEFDTWYSAAGESLPDRMKAAPPASFTLNKELGTVVLTTRGAEGSSFFGWDGFENPADYALPGTKLSDDTPDLRNSLAAQGARFESLHERLNRASSGNYYSGHSAATAIVDERITVPSNGAPGVVGKTTIVAQLLGTGLFPNSWTFSDINGVAPEVVAGVNGANRGQVWVKWELDGNQSSYQFTLGSSPNQTHMSFDKIEIDTWFSEAGESLPDSMILSEPAALTHLMDQSNGPVVPSSRGGRDTTYFGWDTFGVPGPAAVINDNTPDIGSDATGLARFQTTNGEVHQMAGGTNIYFLSGTLAERVTVPTDGLVGSAGFTTIILQISSATGGFGGSTFAGPITLSAINGVAPEVVQGSGALSAMLWAKWVVPGNQPTYEIDISGPPGQAHFSIDQVVVDTKYSRYEGVGDVMRAKTVEILTESLVDAVKNESYSVQLELEGGTAPHSWSLVDGAVLPAGMSLSEAGLLSGVPTELGPFSFAVEVEDAGGFSDQKTLMLEVRTALMISTAATLPTGVVGVPYEFELKASQGVAPYQWAVTGGDLPSGINLATNGVLSGSPSVAGDAVVTVEVTDAEGGKAERVFTLPVSATLLAPIMQPVPVGVLMVGQSFELGLTALNYPASFQAAGLPRGVRLTGSGGQWQLGGQVLLPGVYRIQVRASNAAGASAWMPVDLVVQALAVGHFGSFTAWSGRSSVNEQLGALISVKTTSAGAYTLGLKIGRKTHSLRGFLAAIPPQIRGLVAGEMLELNLDAQSGAITGTHGVAAVSGWRHVWDKNVNPASQLEGYYSMALELDADHVGDVNLPKGTGFATFSVPSSGAVRLRGKTADGQNLVAASAMGPQGQLAVYALQHKNKGSVLGEVTLEVDEIGSFADIEIGGDLTWQKPATSGRVYAEAFGPLDLGVVGGYLAQSSRRQTVLGLPETGEFAVQFFDAGIEDSATLADVSGVVWTDAFRVVLPAVGNAAGLKLKLNRSTGAMSGSFTLTETSPPLVRRNNRFFGQVVRTADVEVKAVGFFLLPQIPVGGQSIRNAPVLSGRVQAVQVAP